MQGAGDSDGGGVEKETTPTEDKAVELRKSCDYCVKLKRACDGKNPCSLCSRRHKPCTRSARKKSGPAKGTKYAPRRKRSMIAEWADRATLRAREPVMHEYLGGGSIEGGGGLGGISRGGSGGGAGGGPFDHHPYPMSSAEAAAARESSISQFQAGAGGGQPSQSHLAAGSSSHTGRRFGGEAPPWTEERLGGVRGSELGRRPSISSSSGLPFPMGWYASAPHERPEGGAADGGGRDHRRLAPHLEPPMGYPPTSTEGISRREQQHAPVARDSWSLASLEAEGAGERTSAAGEPTRRRSWEAPPSSSPWTSQSDHLLGSQGEGMAMAYGKRVRLSPPAVPKRSSMRQGGESASGSVPHSSREWEAGHHPTERHREGDPPSSIPVFPPPREPPNPTAGYSFHPAANRNSWRRSSHAAPWESPGGGSGGRAVDRDDPGVPPHFGQPSMFYDSSDRPSPSWSASVGAGGAGGFAGSRRYYDDYRSEPGDVRQERGGGGRGDSAQEWQFIQQHGGGAGGDVFREREREHERLELRPPPLHAPGRHPHQHMERPLAGEEERPSAELLLGTPPPPPPRAAAIGRDERGRQHQMSARIGAGSAFERTDRRAGGHVDPPYQRLDRGRQDTEPSHQEWEMRPWGVGGGGVPYQWDESIRRPTVPSTSYGTRTHEDSQRREGDGGRGMSHFSTSASPAGLSSQADDEREERRGNRSASGGTGDGQQR